MSNVQQTTEENKTNNVQAEVNNQDSMGQTNVQQHQGMTNVQQKSEQEIVADLLQRINQLFTPSNLMRNSYLTNRATGIQFEIPVKFIYEEMSIRQMTTNASLVNQALAQSDNVIVHKNGQIIDTVKPKQSQIKIRIDIKGLKSNEKDEFKSHVYKLAGNPHNIFDYQFNEKMSIVEIICDSEHNADELHNALKANTFESANTLDISLVTETLYITCTESLKKKRRTFDPSRQGNNPRQNPKFVPYMNPYMQYPMMMNQMNQPYYGMNQQMMNPNPYYYGQNQQNYNNKQNNYQRGGGYMNNQGGNMNNQYQNQPNNNYKKPYNPNHNNHHNNQHQNQHNQHNPNNYNNQNFGNSNNNNNHHHHGNNNNHHNNQYHKKKFQNNNGPNKFNKGGHKGGKHHNKPYNPPNVQINNNEFPPLSEDANQANQANNAQPTPQQQTEQTQE